MRTTIKKYYAIPDGENPACAICDNAAATSKLGIVVRGKMVIFPACDECGKRADEYDAAALLANNSIAAARCQKCNAADATATVGFRIRGKIREIHLCRDCAADAAKHFARD